MKLISDHLGQIIAALAAVAILITSVVFFKAPIGDFFGGIVDKETSIGDNIVANVDEVDLTTLNIKLLNGNGQQVDKAAYAPLSFRSNANIDDFKEVKVDGSVVDSMNYTLTEGSTIVTFKQDFTEALSIGEHTISIVSEPGSADGDFGVISSNVIPAGATYTVSSTSEVLEAGDEFPESIGANDVYTYGNYEYTYLAVTDSSRNGWNVKLNLAVTDKNQSSYGEVLDCINGQPVKHMVETFYGCSKLISAPTIPSNVDNLSKTFMNCRSLTTAPIIHDGVRGFNQTFYSCVNLVNAPVIPDGVKEMKKTFFGCAALSKAPNIPDTVKDMEGTFQGCKSLTTAPKLPNSLEDFSYTFYDCENLVNAPVIPDGVKEMYDAFRGCKNLITYDGASEDLVDGDFSAYIIPDSVTNISYAFCDCVKLTSAPTIPSNVTNLYATFMNCTSLTGTVIINANPEEYYSKCFENTVKNIKIIGSCPTATKALLAATATNGNVTY